MLEIDKSNFETFKASLSKMTLKSLKHAYGSIEGLIANFYFYINHPDFSTLLVNKGIKFLPALVHSEDPRDGLKPTSCLLRRLNSAPSPDDAKHYIGFYLYLSNEQSLLYVELDGTYHPVPIQDKEKFKSFVDSHLADKLWNFLSEEEIKEHITDDSGHVPSSLQAHKELSIRLYQACLEAKSNNIGIPLETLNKLRALARDSINARGEDSQNLNCYKKAVETPLGVLQTNLKRFSDNKEYVHWWGENKEEKTDSERLGQAANSQEENACFAVHRVADQLFSKKKLNSKLKEYLSAFREQFNREYSNYFEPLLKEVKINKKVLIRALLDDLFFATLMYYSSPLIDGIANSHPKTFFTIIEEYRPDQMKAVLGKSTKISTLYDKYKQSKQTTNNTHQEKSQPTESTVEPVALPDPRSALNVSGTTIAASPTNKLIVPGTTKIVEGLLQSIVSVSEKKITVVEKIKPEALPPEPPIRSSVSKQASSSSSSSSSFPLSSLFSPKPTLNCAIDEIDQDQYQLSDIDISVGIRYLMKKYENLRRRNAAIFESTNPRDKREEPEIPNNQQSEIFFMAPGRLDQDYLDVEKRTTSLIRDLADRNEGKIGLGIVNVRGNHWVTLIMAKLKGRYKILVIDPYMEDKPPKDFKTKTSKLIESILKATLGTDKTDIRSIPVSQQIDMVSCGYICLENCRNQIEGNLVTIRNQSVLSLDDTRLTLHAENYIGKEDVFKQRVRNVRIAWEARLATEKFQCQFGHDGIIIETGPYSIQVMKQIYEGKLVANAILNKIKSDFREQREAVLETLSGFTKKPLLNQNDTLGFSTNYQPIYDFIMDFISNNTDAKSYIELRNTLKPLCVQYGEHFAPLPSALIAVVQDLFLQEKLNTFQQAFMQYLQSKGHNFLAYRGDNIINSLYIEFTHDLTGNIKSEFEWIKNYTNPAWSHLPIVVSRIEEYSRSRRNLLAPPSQQNNHSAYSTSSTTHTNAFDDMHGLTMMRNASNSSTSSSSISGDIVVEPLNKGTTEKQLTLLHDFEIISRSNNKPLPELPKEIQPFYDVLVQLQGQLGTLKQLLNASASSWTNFFSKNEQEVSDLFNLVQRTIIWFDEERGLQGYRRVYLYIADHLKSLLGKPSSAWGKPLTLQYAIKRPLARLVGVSEQEISHYDKAEKVTIQKSRITGTGFKFLHGAITSKLEELHRNFGIEKTQDEIIGSSKNVIIM